jgi:hypothetical protein
MTKENLEKEVLSKKIKDKIPPNEKIPLCILCNQDPIYRGNICYDCWHERGD